MNSEEAEMDHTNHIRLRSDELNQANLGGAPIYGRDDDEISTVDHVHGVGDRAKVVFDVGGFLGIGSRRVSLYAGQLDFMRDSDGIVHGVTQMTEYQLKALPEHSD
jgi:hypothetical protein